MKVYDVPGREVKTLVEGVKNPGSYGINFDTNGLSGGVCSYRLSAGTLSGPAGAYAAEKKMIILK